MKLKILKLQKILFYETQLRECIATFITFVYFCHTQIDFQEHYLSYMHFTYKEILYFANVICMVLEKQFKIWYGKGYLHMRPDIKTRMVQKREARVSQKMRKKILLLLPCTFRNNWHRKRGYFIQVKKKKKSLDLILYSKPF